MDDVLVIIDMQAGFQAAFNAITIKACQEEIIRCIENNKPIVFVEYKYNGETYSGLTSLVEDYDLKFFLEKEQDDACELLMNFFNKIKVMPKKIRICGVNTDACVLSTVYSLYTASCFKLEIVRKACNSTSPISDVEKVFTDLNQLGIKII